MKKIQYSVALMKNPIHDEDPEKVYANIQQTGVVSLDELAEHITEHNSVFSKGIIVGILTELGVCMRELILQDYLVVLGVIGNFSPSIKSSVALTLTSLTS